MALNTLAALAAGLQPPVVMLNHNSDITGPSYVGITSTARYQAGLPAAAGQPNPGAGGEALIGPNGDLPLPAIEAGQDVRIASLLGTFWGTASMYGYPVLIDRLWQGANIALNSTAAQTVDSVAWPARDANNSSNGEGVFIAVESGGVGAGSPVFSMTYTNSNGVAGRTATGLDTAVANASSGAWFIIGLQAGDSGVRSVQTFQLSSTMASGSVRLVAFRPLYMGDVELLHMRQNFNLQDAIRMALPKLHPETFLSLCRGGANSKTASGSTQGCITFSVG